MITQYSDRFREHSGLSAETKPTTSVRPGDEFVEINTGKRYKYNSDGSAWIEQITKTGYALKKITTNFNRPSDTTLYAIGDAITDSAATPTIFQFDLSTIGAVNGQSLEIRKITVCSSVKQSTLPLFNVYLSPTTFTATNDNSALDIDDTTMENSDSWFACVEQSYTASNCCVSKSNINTPLVLSDSDTILYGTLQAANGYTPVSGEKFTILVWVVLL